MSATSSSPSEPSAAVEPRAALCRHFGSCGGCSVQDLPYEEQLARKRARVEAALAPLGLGVDRVHPSPRIWHYRNKMEFSFGDVYPPKPGGPTVLLGLKERGRWYRILDLSDCRLLSPETPALLCAVRDWAEREKVPPYNSRRHTGTLRHLVVRESKNGPERLVSLIHSPGELPARSFVEAVLQAYPATTVLAGSNAKLSDTAIPDSLKPLLGPGHITETLRFAGRELRLRISPLSFFQTNTNGTEVLYGLLRDRVREDAPRALLDLYCGGGGIALSLADLCGEVHGVEVNSSAVEDARANAAFNGIGSARFYSGSVELLLPALLDLKPQAAVVDPPRAGLQPKTVKALADWGPRVVHYVSCNPEALGRDLALLGPFYAPSRAEVVDLFPHTEHVETLVRLERRPGASSGGGGR